MSDIAELLRQGAGSVGWRTALVSTSLAYVLCQSIAFVYAKTYRGLSYSRSMAQALVVAGIVAAMLMIAIGDSLARGIGIVGTLALIRFRTNIRDPLDMVFVFSAFGAGIACGTGSYGAAFVGTAMFLLVIVMLRVTGFGAFREHEGVVRLRLPVSEDEPGAALERRLEEVLRGTCARFVLVTLREVAQGAEMERAYQVTFKNDGDEDALVSGLREIGASGVVLSLQEPSVEL